MCEGLSITGRPAARNACLTSRAIALMALALGVRRFKCRTAAAALAATLGGMVEVKMNEGA